jgi:hypothetical protein
MDAPRDGPVWLNGDHPFTSDRDTLVRMLDDALSRR